MYRLSFGRSNKISLSEIIILKWKFIICHIGKSFYIITWQLISLLMNIFQFLFLFSKLHQSHLSGYRISLHIKCIWNTSSLLLFFRFNFILIIFLNYNFDIIVYKINIESSHPIKIDQGNKIFLNIENIIIDTILFQKLTILTW
jgi:hypothetical protein